MIEYDYAFIYSRLTEKGYTLDFLREEKILSQSTLQRIRHNRPINTKTIDTLCTLIECVPQDLIRYSRQARDLQFINAIEKKVYGETMTTGTAEPDEEKRRQIPWPKTID